MFADNDTFNFYTVIKIKEMACVHCNTVGHISPKFGLHNGHIFCPSKEIHSFFF